MEPTQAGASDAFNRTSYFAFNSTTHKFEYFSLDSRLPQMMNERSAVVDPFLASDSGIKLERGQIGAWSLRRPEVEEGTQRTVRKALSAWPVRRKHFGKSSTRADRARSRSFCRLLGFSQLLRRKAIHSQTRYRSEAGNARVCEPAADLGQADRSPSSRQRFRFGGLAGPAILSTRCLPAHSASIAILQPFAKTPAQLQSSPGFQHDLVITGLFELQGMNPIEVDDDRAVDAHEC